MGRKSMLTTELIEAIAERIRVGTYPYVAAAACGVPKSTYYRWMQRAEEERAPKLHRELRDKIAEAAAAARSNAEVRVFRDRPFEWLRYGPGRDQPGEPGWTETPQTLRLEGGEVPIQLQAAGFQRPAPLRTLAEAFAQLEELGFIQPGPMGRAMFGAGQGSCDEVPTLPGRQDGSHGESA